MEKGESYKAVSEPSLFLFFFFIKKGCLNPIFTFTSISGDHTLYLEKKNGNLTL